MNNEIKEILKILKKCEFGACITKHNSRVLLDYITNLQEENKKLKERVQIGQNAFLSLNSKIDKAIELIKRSAGYKGICTQPKTDTLSILLEILEDKGEDKE